MAPENHASKPVCVMDASGCLGSALVCRLLQRDYTVHAALQSHGELQLNGVSCDNSKLKIFRSDPFDYQSIIDALKGCSALFYSFQPPHDQLSYDEQTAEVEVRAAHNVLEACAQTETIEKVVFTSSVTAVVWRDDRKSTLLDFDETHWSDINFCRKFKLWHALSKTLAEKMAWGLAMDRGLNLVSINAGFLNGPDLVINNPYLKGAAEMYDDGVLVTVDLSFLADAYICVFEDSSAYGRYLCFNNVVNTPQEAFKLIRILSPLPQSYKCEESKMIQQRISNKKLNKLMVGYQANAN